ncbi:MAG: Crp/Fnr family transcriptional regulator [Saprospiraceae bacterium]
MEAAKKLAFIEELPLFDCLNQDQKIMLSNCMELKTKRKYSFIYMPDEVSNHLFFLTKGTVKIGTHSSDGREVIKAVLHPTAMFGELGLVGEENRQDFARAMNEEVQLCVIKVSDFQKLMESNHNLCLRVISLMGKRLRRAENRLESLIFKDARSRIVEFLKDSVSKRGRRVGYEMLLKHSLTQQDIANLTGTSRQTVTSVLNDLRKSDLIYFNRRSILIRDMANLA